ncbi:major facilitator superfamily domain-containing protein [Microdochium trichocladiopsis]|uniref:Major facilitator superfamily domain-containing protein n=1 Tax=Microdochium trichocladiopsis TaxID=1682393 RepID=A0A9P8XPE6_9PEZI|nr:major facilitator superfamily domain-containing protein [Microdochium trichocladiopsis]KAH7009243.1 major facilitator superfamily domain-containing protein [Microdochium trichocladiopsis]
MSSEKAAPTDSDTAQGVSLTTDESRLSHSPDTPDNEVQLQADGPPDGGTGAWLAVLGAWCCSFNSFGWMNSVGVFQSYYEFGPLKDYDSSTIAWIPSLEIFFLIFLGPAAGFLFDKYGPTPLILVGTFLHVFGLMMASLATEYYQFLLAQGVCSAIGLSFLYSPAISTIATWFHKKRGLAMGIMVTGSSLGGVVFPIMLNRLIENPSTGYPWAMRISAFVVLALQIVAIFTLRPRKAPAAAPAPKKSSAVTLAAPFKEFPFVVMLLGMFILMYGIFIPVNFLALQALEQAHVSESMSLYLVAIFNGASLFGRLGSGYWSDIAGRWNVFVIAGAASGIIELALWIPATYETATIGFAVAFGFLSGAFVSLLAALPATVSPLPQIGYRIGVVMLVLSLPALTMAPIGGRILTSASSLDEGWLNVKIFGGVMSLAGSAVVFYARTLYSKKFWAAF